MDVYEIVTEAMERYDLSECEVYEDIADVRCYMEELDG